MPILQKESEIYPADLFEIEAPWQVAHVRSRQEKVLARFLATHQKPFYLPQVDRVVKRDGRTFTSHLPLFSGYVFLRRVAGAEIIWRSNVVVSILDVPDQEQLTMELRQIRSLQERGAMLTPVSDIAAGDAVRITEGAFRDYVGTVVREKGTSQLIISVTTLRKSVAVEFPRDAVVRSRSGAQHRRV
jgi:transcription antitermination factor NusG